MKKSEVLRLMNDIQENMPLSGNNADDARYVWPERWRELFDQIEAYPNGTTQCGYFDPNNCLLRLDDCGENCPRYKPTRGGGDD